MSLTPRYTTADLCVIGQGISAFTAALAAARHGLSTLWVLEGAPAFCPRFTVCPGEGNRETGIAEELLLFARRENPSAKDCLPVSVWESVLSAEPNLCRRTGKILRFSEAEGVLYYETEDGEQSVSFEYFADCREQASVPFSLPTDVPDPGAYWPGDGSLRPLSYRLLYPAGTKNTFILGDFASKLPHGTRAQLGQAIGTAAAITKKYAITPGEVLEKHFPEFLETLQYDDCFLPGRERTVSDQALSALLSCDDAVSGDILLLRSGTDRSHESYGEGEREFTMNPGAAIEYQTDAPVDVTRVRIVFDSDLNRDADTPGMPGTLAKVFALEAETEAGWEGILFENENRRRLVTAAVCRPVTGIRLTVLESWGGGPVRLLSFDFE